MLTLLVVVTLALAVVYSIVEAGHISDYIDEVRDTFVVAESPPDVYALRHVLPSA